MTALGRASRAMAGALLLGFLMGCGSRVVLNPAPVEDRSPPRRLPAQPPVGSTKAPGQAPAAATPAASAAAGPTAATPAPAALSGRTPSGTENAGKPGYYTVKPGDTLIRIGLDNGQSWRDIARWNGIDKPNLIEVGQVLRVAPPGVEPGSAVAVGVAQPARVESRPLEGRAEGGSSPAGAAASTTGSASAASGAPPRPTATTQATGGRAGDEALTWMWPASGSVLAPFDEARNAKGLSISGNLGDPVLAAADGRVVYAGAGLRGYGNLVIVKHNEVYLSAYAHNKTLLVEENQAVRRGQKIAEMGSSDSERVQLHFEIRRSGKPVDPVRLLPVR